jgi:hypothetical protein
MDGMAIEAIKQAIIDEFDVDAEQAKKDLYGFIAGMIKEGVLHEESITE